MKKIATLCAMGALLALPASALAKNIQQQGQIVHDDATSVKLRVKVHGSTPVKVAGFKAKNVMVRCEDGPSRINFTALTPVDVDGDNGFKVRLSDGHGGILRINGKVKNGGKATVGSLKTNDFHSGKTTCKAPKQRFKTAA
jgi:hypothetical protein